MARGQPPQRLQFGGQIHPGQPRMAGELRRGGLRLRHGRTGTEGREGVRPPAQSGQGQDRPPPAEGRQRLPHGGQGQGTHRRPVGSRPLPARRHPLRGRAVGGHQKAPASGLRDPLSGAERQARRGAPRGACAVHGGLGHRQVHHRQRDRLPPHDDARAHARRHGP